MADDGEYANDSTETMLSAKLASRVVYTGVSAENCEECDTPILQARRKAIPGCQLCAFCQTKLERKTNGRRQ
jgi:phage/conjugal plasmid C-4 type zinc finger TraR family protein